MKVYGYVEKNWKNKKCAVSHALHFNRDGSAIQAN
jgi:hypothetical protein